MAQVATIHSRVLEVCGSMLIAVNLLAWLVSQKVSDCLDACIALLESDSSMSPSQGGGVYIQRGTVTFTSCSIYQNTAASVSATLLNGRLPVIHRPR